MESTEILSTLAQIALGLVGFTGVVIALDHEPSEMNRVRAFRMNVLVFPSSGALFLALLPLVLNFLFVDTGELWKISNAANAIFTLGYLAWIVPASRATMKVAPEIFNMSVWRFFVSGHWINVLIQILAVTPVLNKINVGVYLSGLLWLLFVSLVQFRRMLLIHQAKNHGD
jgi:hypothetical protein